MMRRKAFTLLELLVVIGIIAVLIGILIPVVGRVRERAYAADTKSFVNQLSAAIENYHQEFRAYPGPLPNNEIRNPLIANPQYPQAGVPINASFPLSPAVPAAVGTTFDTAQNNMEGKVTMPENLVLGLLGGLRTEPAGPAPEVRLRYDPSIVGRGPMSLNPGNPKRFEPYFTSDSHLSWRDKNGRKTGRYQDGTNFEIDDTIIPEFVDSFPESMPVLYLRAKPGVPVILPAAATFSYNSVITNDPNFSGNTVAGTGRLGAYDLSQIIAYTASYDAGAIENQPASSNAAPTGSQTIGTGKNPPKRYYKDGQEIPYNFPNHGLRTVDKDHSLTMSPTYYYPLDAFPYIQNPAVPNTARNKDSYILISAGPDRMYGTNDDIVNFGSVTE